MPPAIASPKDRPKDPAAELTPAASLIRVSSIGASVKLLSCDTSRPRPAPAIISGTVRYQPEVASGTIGISNAMPAVLSANPVRISAAGRRFLALRPASMAMANMVSESGASDRPASSASYSSLICRKIGSAIIAPPSVICCSIC